MVPEGWNRIALEKIAEVRSGVAKGKNGLKMPIEVPYLRVANVQDGHVDLSEVKTIEIEHDKLERYSLKYGDVLMNEGGDYDKLGRGDVWLGQIEPCLHQNHVFAVRPNQEIVDSFFLAALAASNYGKTYFLSCAKRSTNLASINSTQIKEFPVLVPPLPEQKKIAQILSTWDKAITTTEQLHASSKQQKKALMQQLLTGKMRLLDKNGVRFCGEWKEYNLEDVFSFKKGKGLSKADLSEGGANKCILYGELYTRYSEVVRTVHSRTNQIDGTPSVSGDILIPSSTTTSGIDLANATAILEDDVLLGGDINILRAKKKISASFFSHLLTHIKKHDIASRAQGITIIHLYSSDLKDIKVFIPIELIEQQKIAAVLSDADQEISALQQKLEALKREKKALMQQLLTGKRRVKTS